MSKLTTRAVARPPCAPWEMIRRVLHSPDLQASSKVLLLCVLDHAGHGKSSCTASNATLAREAGLTDRRTRTLLAELEAYRWLDSDRPGGKYGARSFRPGRRAEGGSMPPGGWLRTAGGDGRRQPGGLAIHRPDDGCQEPTNDPDNDPENGPDSFALMFFRNVPEFAACVPTGG